MELSKGSITGITIAIIAFLIASFGVFIYLRRRRRRQRRAAAAANNTTTTTIANSTSATTSSTTPYSHKNKNNNNNASESHELQSRQKLPTTGLMEDHQEAHESRTEDPELGNGFGATPTMKNETPFPNLDIPTTAEAASSDVTANGGTYATTDAVTGTRSRAAARLTADFDIDLEKQPHFVSSDRPSSLHKAVLEVGGKNEETEDVNCTGKDGGETKTENSNTVVKDVSQRPTGYTGAWP